MKVKKTSIPQNSLANNYLPANYTDAFCCDVITKHQLTADDLQISFWTVMPKWVEALFNLRNLLVKPFGLQSDNFEQHVQEFEDCIRNGKSTKLASLSARSENETVICLNDKHLKANMSVLIKDIGAQKKRIYLSTIVHFHNWTGRAYFYAICPFHHLIVRSMLKSTLKRIEAAGK